jgi:oligopeptide/dipeptide ABC transporter ATP-binding protein
LTTAGASDELLRIENLSLDYVSPQRSVHALNGASLTILRSQMVGVVGESGSGKSTLAYATIRLLPQNARIRSGRVVFDGVSLLDASEGRLKEIRGRRISMVFQDPMTSLNPLFRVKDQLGRVLELHRGIGGRQAQEQSLALLKMVELPDPELVLGMYPFELSGGMQQRVMIAMALSTKPDLIIADEPTSAVDATIQVQILELLARLKEESGFSMLFITHNLDVVSVICDQVAVMYAGSVVETGRTSEIFRDPKHPYTQALLASIPRPRRSRDEPKKLKTIGGAVPDLVTLPQGCKFHPRCPLAFDRCRTEDPAMKRAGEGRQVACHLY